MEAIVFTWCIGWLIGTIVLSLGAIESTNGPTLKEWLKAEGIWLGFCVIVPFIFMGMFKFLMFLWSH